MHILSRICDRLLCLPIEFPLNNHLLKLVYQEVLKYKDLYNLFFLKLHLTQLLMFSHSHIGFPQLAKLKKGYKIPYSFFPALTCPQKSTSLEHAYGPYIPILWPTS